MRIEYLMPADKLACVGNSIQGFTWTTTYHCKHHQSIIPSESFYQLYSDETSQANGQKRKTKENNGDDKDRFTATFELSHIQTMLTILDLFKVLITLSPQAESDGCRVFVPNINSIEGKWTVLLIPKFQSEDFKRGKDNHISKTVAGTKQRAPLAILQ